jgi:uncharacterized delta-60 repeat protein
MKTRLKLCLLLITLALLLELPTKAQTFNLLTLDSTNNTGQHTSAAIVNGKPAIAYYDATDHDLRYVQATDAAGTTWGTPVTVSAANSGKYCSLAVVNGFPAISYYDAANKDLHYVRADDADGTSWTTPPVAVHTTGDTGQYTCLRVVGGLPAISYYDAKQKRLEYVRAMDANGTAPWGAAVTVDDPGGAGAGEYASMTIVDGNPAISCYDNDGNDLVYIRATDATGTGWSAPVIVDNGGGLGGNGQYTSLQVVNGNPAISYHDVANGDLHYVRATNASGTAWGTPVTVDGSSTDCGHFTSLVVVGGVPAISYYDATNKDLHYVTGTDASGTSPWNAPVNVDTTNDVGQYTSLMVLNGVAAISYYEGGAGAGGNLKFTYVPTPNIAVEQPLLTNIPDAGSQDFGNVQVTSRTSITFTIKNPGSANLTGLTITKDGPDNGMFTVTASPTAPVVPTGSTTFTVQFAPTSIGLKTTAIHIASNDLDENPFDITLTGTGVSPEIAVEQPLLMDIPNGGSKGFGSVEVSTNTSLIFTIKNTGSADLAGLVITIDGADPTMFSVTATPTEPVSGPAGSTTFTVQFAPTSAGAKSAALHIASDDTDENPFEINVSGTGIVPILRDATLAWQTPYSGPDAPGTLRSGLAKAVVTQRSGANAGAVFATGFSTSATGGTDIYTVRYDPVTGAMLWAVTFNGAANMADEGNALALDAAGNAVVTGYTTTAAGNTNVFTAKYAAADGALLWQSIYTSGGTGANVGTSVAVDAAGHVAVAGYSQGTTRDMFAARYAAADGTPFFQRRIDGGYNKTDTANAVAVDAAGNVVVAGFVRDATNNKDFRVTKLAAADGATQWNWNVNGTTGLYDEAFAVRVDAAGAVIATGTAVNANYDLYTVKLSSAGVPLWSKMWNSSFNSSDAGLDLVLDGEGDVIVGGHSYRAAGIKDGYVAKYSGATGALIWDRRFNGVANLQDEIRSVDVDAEGNVVATGYSENAGDSSDVLTAKMLECDGGLLWEKIYNGAPNLNDAAVSVAVSPAGQVFIAGYATTALSTTDFLVVSYNSVAPAAQAAQSITFAIPGAQSAGASLNLVASADSGLVVRFSVLSGPAQVDETNNALLLFTGTGTVVVRASQSGNSSYAAALNVDQSFSVAASNQTITFLLPSSIGYTNTETLGGTSSSDLPVSYSIGSGPGVITGNVLSFSGSGNVTVNADQAGDARFNAATQVSRTINAINTPPIIIPSDIELGWSQPYPGTGAGEGRAIALQLNGNAASAIFVAGYTTTATGKDIFLTKRNTDGSSSWISPVVINGAGSGADEASAVVVDSTGDVYISGYVTIAAGNTDIYVAKFSGVNGSNLWAQTFNGSANGLDNASSLVLQSNSHVIIGGNMTNIGAGSDFFGAKLSQADGSTTWSQSFNSAAAQSDSANAVAVGSDGNVALTGISNNDAWTVQLAAADGTLNWQRRYDAASKSDGARGLGIDANNDIVISAYAQTANFDIYTAKYSGIDGSIIWARTYNSSFNSSDHPWSLVLDSSGNLYITGASYPSSGVLDGMTLKYDGFSGTLQWERRYNGPASKNDEFRSISLDGNGNPVVTGFSTNLDATTDVYTAKLSANTGIPIWEQRYNNGAANKSDFGGATAADSGGRAWVTGYQNNASNIRELLLLKYQPMGSPPLLGGDVAASEAVSSNAEASISMQVEQGDIASFAAGYYDAEGNSSMQISAEIDGQVSAGSNVQLDPEAGRFKWQQDTRMSAPGEHQITLTATDSAGASSSLSITLIINANKPERSWRWQHFGNTAAEGFGAADADPDDDGLSNLSEFAFGLDPNRSSSSDVGTRAEAASDAEAVSGMRAVFQRRKDHQAAGLDYIVEFSSNLRDWTPSNAVPKVLSDDGIIEQVAVNFPPKVPGKVGQFFRIRVEPLAH